MEEQQKIILTLFGRQFDFTHFAKIHPGGEQVILKYKGLDATDAFYQAGHLSKLGINEQLTKLEVGKQKSIPQGKTSDSKYIENYFQRIGMEEPKL